MKTDYNKSDDTMLHVCCISAYYGTSGSPFSKYENESKKKIRNLCEGGIEKYVPCGHRLS